MSIASYTPFSLADFLDWEAQQELRYEFDGVHAIGMTGGTASHAAIRRNIAVALSTRFGDQRCQFYGSDLKIEVAGRIRYPDGFVVCRPLDPDERLVRDPIVIFEVMSSSTAQTDTIIKNHEYAATPSIRRYIILAQQAIGATMFERVGADWPGQVLRADATLSMPEIGVEVPIVEFYRGVNLPTGAVETVDPG